MFIVVFDHVLPLIGLLTPESLEYPLKLKSVLPVVLSAQKTFHPASFFTAVRGWEGEQLNSGETGVFLWSLNSSLSGPGRLEI